VCEYTSTLLTHLTNASLRPNTWKLNWNVLTITAVILNLKRVNVCEQMVKTAPRTTVTWCCPHHVFSYIYSLLIEKDICDHQKFSVKFLCVYMSFIRRSFHFLGKSVLFFFPPIFVLFQFSIYQTMCKRKVQKYGFELVFFWSLRATGKSKCLLLVLNFLNVSVTLRKTSLLRAIFFLFLFAFYQTDIWKSGVEESNCQLWFLCYISEKCNFPKDINTTATAIFRNFFMKAN
jgi:hypothetical protein